MDDVVYVVAGCKPWSRTVYQETISKLPGRWEFVGAEEELTAEYVRRVGPRYIFFLHWSWIVPEAIVNNYECICFHMTDLPYGRGGSPLQNLITRRHRTTKLTALRMTPEIDAGPVYFKEDLSLDGSAGEIYLRANRLAARMITRVAELQPQPAPQTGEPVYFKRRKPEESRIRATESVAELYDFIRMLDAEGYPHAFLDHAATRYEFSQAVLEEGRLTATATIKPVPGAQQ